MNPSSYSPRTYIAGRLLPPPQNKRGWQVHRDEFPRDGRAEAAAHLPAELDGCREAEGMDVLEGREGPAVPEGSGEAVQDRPRGGPGEAREGQAGDHRIEGKEAAGPGDLEDVLHRVAGERELREPPAEPFREDRVPLDPQVAGSGRQGRREDGRERARAGAELGHAAPFPGLEARHHRPREEAGAGGDGPHGQGAEEEPAEEQEAVPDESGASLAQSRRPFPISPPSPGPDPIPRPCRRMNRQSRVGQGKRN